MKRALPLLAAFGAAQAAPPLNTDDAGILDTGQCQLELRLRPGRHSSQQYAQPSCNFGGGVEWGLNLAQSRVDGAPAQTLLTLQAKTLLPAWQPAGWGVALNAGLTQALRHAAPGPLAFATLIVSAPPQGGVSLHANAGATKLPGQHAVTTWAGAAEVAVSERWTLLIERYGERHAKPGTQLGARLWLQPNVLQLDATLGHEHVQDRSERYATLGLLWVFDRP